MARTLMERVRKQIGDEGPQLPNDEYEDRIDRELENMSTKELLGRLSDIFEQFFAELGA